MMHLRYDDDFVEAAVFIAASGKRPGAPSLQLRRFHAARERCYSVLDPDECNTAFFTLHLDWFREWGLEKLLLGLLNEYPLLPPALNTLAFRKVRAKKDEAAELYVSVENGRSGVVAMRPERFERDAAVCHFLRHEFMHLSDMVDPGFGYAPEVRAPGMNPSHQRIVRERYRLLWDITIDGRLGRSLECERHRALFDSAFSFWPEARRSEVFSNLWTAKTPSHEELLALATDPRDLSHADHPLPGGSCPLCGFSTFEWADLNALADATLAVIEREFPGWSPVRGACSRCAEVYAIADNHAAALPQ
jgi:hypothetical protein